jgi:hypothetical protein
VTIDEVVAPAVPTLSEDRKVETIEATQGSFDNNLDEVNLALRRILRRAPAHAVTNLKGF